MDWYVIFPLISPALQNCFGCTDYLKSLLFPICMYPVTALIFPLSQFFIFLTFFFDPCADFTGQLALTLSDFQSAPQTLLGSEYLSCLSNMGYLSCFVVGLDLYLVLLDQKEMFSIFLTLFFDRCGYFTGHLALTFSASQSESQTMSGSESSLFLSNLSHYIADVLKL